MYLQHFRHVFWLNCTKNVPSFRDDTACLECLFFVIVLFYVTCIDFYSLSIYFLIVQVVSVNPLKYNK